MKKGYIYDSPVGKLRIVESEKGICEMSFYGEAEGIIIEETALVKQTHQQLLEYFVGKRRIFDIPLDMQGTAFQIKTWQALQHIPYGETWTYKDLAIAVGNEKASRAVGGANNKNPIGIIVPCHRVIGITGKMVGYGGGVERKEFLLNLEKKYK